MTNHVHLLVRMGVVPLSDILQTVHTKYAKYFNRTHDTSGHVFQGRPGIKIVLDESYLSTLVSYIHRNPTEANIVPSVTDYDWSSWPIFFPNQSPWIEPACWQYPPGFQQTPRRTFEEVVDAKESTIPGGNNYIGTSDQWEELEKRREGRGGRKFRERRERRRKSEIVARVLRNIEFSLEQLQGPSRARDLSSVRHRAMALMYEEGYGTAEVAKYFNRTPMIVVRAHRKWKQEENS